MTPVSDMSNHGLLPVVASSQSSASYQSTVLTSTIPSIYSSTSSPSSHSIQNYILPPPTSSSQYPDVSYGATTAPGNRTSLPSMRTIDSITQHAPPNGGGPVSPNMHHTTSPPPPPILTPSSTSTSTSTSSSSNPHGPLYSAILPSNYGLAPENMARYATLPQNRHSSLPREPKKEIKRRTKTGCLTCRKRRIKCDENHPKCNNCIKSKRHCLGYDPVFRAPLRLINSFRDTHGTHVYIDSPSSEFKRVLVPAPPAGPPIAGLIVPPSLHHSEDGQLITAPVPAPTPAAAPAASSYVSPPSSNGNGLHQPCPASANAHTATAVPHEPKRPGSDPNYPPSVTATREPSQPPPILPAILPAKGVREPRTLPAAPSAWDSSRPLAPPRLYESSPYPPGPAGPSIPCAYGESVITTVAPAVKMKVDEIINTLGPSPQTPQKMNHSEETFSEITKVYHEMYARGLSAFFETVWYYFSDNGKMSFPRDPSLTDNMASFLKILETAQPHDHSYMAYSGVLETRIVWQLAQTALRAASEKTNNAMRVSLPPDGDPIEARNRIHVVETLLSGDYLASNPLTPPLQDEDPVRTRQFDFWYHLGEFVRNRPELQPQQTMGARDDILGRLRHLLDGRENRDVLYSIAVVRDLAPLFESNYLNTVPQHLDESDPKNRLAVASRLILDESQATGGTSNVVRRFCDIAGRAFVNPGVNVSRRL